MEGENQNLMNMLLGAGSENGGQQNLEVRKKGRTIKNTI